METSGGGLIAILSSEARAKTQVTGSETWNGRDAQQNRAFYGRDFDVWQSLIFGLFHFDGCGCSLKLKWQHGSESESIQSRLAFCKDCPPRPKGVLTSSGTSLPLRVCQDVCDAGKGGSGKLDPACGHQSAAWWATGTKKAAKYWHTRPTCLEGLTNILPEDLFSFLGCMVLCMYYVDYV